MQVTKFAFSALMAVGMLSTFSTASTAQSITVSNVMPANLVTAGQQVTVTATVTTNGLPNGTYKVTGSITNITGGGIPTQFSSTVVITNGVGNVSVPAVTIPNGTTGNLGKVAVQVDNSLQGGAISGANSSNIRWR